MARLRWQTARIAWMQCSPLIYRRPRACPERHFRSAGEFGRKKGKLFLLGNLPEPPSKAGNCKG